MPIVNDSHSRNPYSYDMEVYAQTADRSMAHSDSAELASGTLHMALCYISGGVDLNQIDWVSGATAMVTGANQWSALYTRNRALLVKSNDATTAAWAANTVKSFTWDTGTFYTVPDSDLYYLALLVNATTPPSLVCAPILNTTISGLNPVKAGRSTTGLTTPATAPANAAAITARAAIPMAWTQ